MARPIRSPNPSVIERLVDQPHRFAFAQAVRLLLAGQVAEHLGAPGGRIGTTDSPADETLRFRSSASLRFATSELTRISIGTSATLNTVSEELDPAPESTQPIEVEVAFWGITGPLGVLPSHYTQLIIDRGRHKDHSLHDFLDLFSHRQLSLFYRAWEKSFLAAGHERGLRDDDPSSELMRQALLSLVGLGTRRVQNRLTIADELHVHYGGLMIDRPNAESLRQMLGDFLGHATEVLSLLGQWLRLPPSEQSQLGTLGGHCGLGIDTVLGERVWDAMSKFRIRVGPVSYEDFLSLMPTGERLTRLCQLIRSYVGCEFSYDIQVVLLANEIPACRLGASSAAEPKMPQPDTNPKPAGGRLGWNTWLCSNAPTRDSEDAVFEHSGLPVPFHSFGTT